MAKSDDRREEILGRLVDHVRSLICAAFANGLRLDADKPCASTWSTSRPRISSRRSSDLATADRSLEFGYGPWFAWNGAVGEDDRKVGSSQTAGSAMPIP